MSPSIFSCIKVGRVYYLYHQFLYTFLNLLYDVWNSINQLV